MQSGASGCRGCSATLATSTATASSGGVLDGLCRTATSVVRLSQRRGGMTAVGYDGQPGDVSLGLDVLRALVRPGGGVVVGGGSWRGELGDPQSLNRYAYVNDSPVSYANAFGFARTRVVAVRVRGRRRRIGVRRGTRRSGSNRVNAHRTTIDSPRSRPWGRRTGGSAARYPRARCISRGHDPADCNRCGTSRPSAVCGPVDWSCRGSQRDRAAIASVEEDRPLQRRPH